MRFQLILLSRDLQCFLHLLWDVVCSRYHICYVRCRFGGMGAMRSPYGGGDMYGDMGYGGYEGYGGYSEYGGGMGE